MKNKKFIFLIPLFLIFVSCTDYAYSYRSRVLALSSDDKSYECNQKITLSIAASKKSLNEQASGAFSVYKKNADNGYDLYSNYKITSNDVELTKGDTTCIFLIDLGKLESKTKIYFSIPDAGEYKITMSLFRSTGYWVYDEQYYVEFVVTETPANTIIL